MAKFITLEGAEGVGKTTNLAFIEQQLKQRGQHVMCTREPGGTALGEQLREVLLHSEAPIDEMAELLMMFAARAQHLKEKIRPALDGGQWVLSDRFTDSSFAYQAYGRGMSLDRLQQLQGWVHAGLDPDLTILLDAPVEIGMARAKRRGALDRFEKEQNEFFERVRQGFLSQARAHPQRFVVIDASQDLAQVQAHIAKALDALF